MKYRYSFLFILNVISLAAYDARGQKQKLFMRLYEVGVVKFGSFKLKSGQISPIYFDLRIIVSYPDILQSLAECIWHSLPNYDFDCICGVPYTALPIATAVSLGHSKPMIMKRKEAKDYGTKKILEGVFKAGDSCLVIEDVVTSGGSILETIESLEREGLHISHSIVCINREQGGLEHVAKKGYSISALFNLTEIIAIAHDAGLITEQQQLDICQFISANPCI